MKECMQVTAVTNNKLGAKQNVLTKVQPAGSGASKRKGKPERAKV